VTVSDGALVLERWDGEGGVLRVVTPRGKGRRGRGRGTPEPLKKAWLFSCSSLPLSFLLEKPLLPSFLKSQFFGTTGKA
jgi:hypothetical protein